MISFVTDIDVHMRERPSSMGKAFVSSLPRLSFGGTGASIDGRRSFGVVLDNLSTTGGLSDVREEEGEPNIV